MATFYDHVEYIDQETTALGHILTAHRVMKALQQRGIPAHLGDLSERDLAYITVTGHDDHTFHIADDGWTVIQHTPTPDNEDNTTTPDSPINTLPATAPPHSVAHAIKTYISMITNT